MDDLISKQAAIDAVNKALSRVFTEPCGEQILKDLPSAQPEPHWIPCSVKLPTEGQLIYASFPYLQCCQVLEYSTYIRNAINAWVPLPEPYKGGDK